MTSAGRTDPMTSRERAVVAALEALGADRARDVRLPTMDPSARDALRAQLVAATPRLVAEGRFAGGEQPTAADTRQVARLRPDARLTSSRATVPEDEDAAGPTAAATPIRTGPLATVTSLERDARRRKMVTVSLGVAAAVVVATGGAAYASRSALPGDPLYAVKRASEQVKITLSSSDVDKGHAYLVSAQTRVEEAIQLLSAPSSLRPALRYTADGDDLSSQRQQDIADALSAADDETQQGVATLGDDAIEHHDSAPLDLMVAWASGQIDRIDELVRRLPAGTSRDAATTSADEIRQALERAAALHDEIAAGVTCTSPGRDRFGPEPCGPIGAAGIGPARSPSEAPTAGPSVGPSSSAVPGGSASPSGGDSSSPTNSGSSATGTPTGTPGSGSGSGGTSSGSGGVPINPVAPTPTDPLVPSDPAVSTPVPQPTDTTVPTPSDTASPLPVSGISTPDPSTPAPPPDPGAV